MDAAAVRTDTWLGFHVFKLWFWFQFHSDWVTVAFGHTEMKWTSLKFDSELCCTRTTHTHKLVFRSVSVNSTFCLCSMCAPTYGLWIKLRVCVRWCMYSCTSARASKRSTFSHTASITPVGFSCLRDGARGAFFSFHSPGLPLFCPVLSSIGLWLSAKKPGDVCCPPLPSKRPKSLFSEFLRVLRCLAQFCKTRIVQ